MKQECKHTMQSRGNRQVNATKTALLERWSPKKKFPLGLLLIFFPCVAIYHNANADTLYVDSLNGVDISNRCIRWDRPCETLAHAVEVAAGGDTLELLAQDYPAENILIDKPLTIVGINKSHTRVIGTGNQRHFTISVGATEIVSFSQMAFTEGNAVNENGGAVLVNGGNLELQRTVFESNQADQGGAIACEACDGIFIYRSEFIHNRASGRDGNGGAVYASYMPNNESRIELVQFAANRADQHGGALFLRDVPLTVSKTAFSENGTTRPSGRGGAIFSTNADLSLDDSTLDHNRASVIDGKGGGLYAELSSRLWLTNTTFSENDGGNYGGALALQHSNDTIITNSTFYGNRASVGGGTFSNVGNYELRYSIVADSRGAHDCFGRVPGGYDNSLGDASCEGSMTSVIAPVTGLGPLQDNGGPTATHAIAPGSNAHNAVVGNCYEPNGNTLITDQRGFRKPFQDCDIGSFEYQNFAPGTYVESGQSLSNNMIFTTALGDIDGDGDLDMVVGNIEFNPTRVFINQGNGRFIGNGQALGVGWVMSIALADVDGDGDLDLIESRISNGSALSIYLNDGSGVFSSSGQTFLTFDARTMAVGDVDNDGDQDIAVGSSVGGGSRILTNDGSGHFVDNGPLGTGWNCVVILGDIDADGDLDLLEANSAENVAYINDGNGVFQRSNQTLGRGDSYIALGDIDGDGDLDMVEGVRNNESLHIYVNEGNGPHDSGQTLGNYYTRTVTLGDVDSDGDLDLIQGTSNDGLFVYFNDGAGNFSSSDRYDSPFSIIDVTLGDMDNDGDLDMATVGDWYELKLFINMTP